ncbi:phosphatase PAP2 family protein [Acinetobacter boissieri]|nr:phosphatase PAP2 family protein [Acinetobacter boissieri]
MLHNLALHALDDQMLIWVTQYRTTFLDSLTILMSKLGGMPAFIVVLCIYGVVFVKRKKYVKTAFLLLSSIGAIGIGWSLKYAVNRDRPQLIEHLVQSYGASFPSAHSLYAAVLATFTLLFVCQDLHHKYRNICIYIISYWPIAMGTSRVYLGVHYPSDVLAGWGVGFIWVALLYLLYQHKYTPHFHEKSKLKIEVKS